MNKRSLLPIAALIVALNANAQGRTADPLGPLAQCVNNGEFHFEKLDRFPMGKNSRVVNTSAGQVQVTVADGYRLMIYRKSSSPLVNLKIERSVEGQFAADRTTLITQMKEMAASSKAPHIVPLETSMRNGVEVLALNNPSIDHANGIISFYTLLEARSGTVASAYVLNQRPEVREYSTDAEYATLRDRFIGLLTECMGRAAQ
jgi:hypothetical protein